MGRGNGAHLGGGDRELVSQGLGHEFGKMQSSQMGGGAG